ncbi:transcriptional regulator, TetR family [Actinopolyspora xinjiangensis]|uniref:Transcriptional regulator, TetR family n=1 Tax=Actinopolyspora xinjiangensis TaxID=405564 RepID=A0A1H0RCK7_9ACTN|nr:helix-turn-helix domain-containing protein [Actinopolyspora xinjiangensis]SDP27145.1 transcriptional regulator, TetR family [Actinopolyspora xinjiangensis]
MVGVPRFDREAVLLGAAETFAERGYEGASVSHLVAATSLQRGSLYGAFDSKAGLFRAAFEQVVTRGVSSELLLDLLVVALRERAAADPRVAELVRQALVALDGASGPVAEQIYARLLARAGLPADNQIQGEIHG